MGQIVKRNEATVCRLVTKCVLIRQIDIEKKWPGTKKSTSNQLIKALGVLQTLHNPHNRINVLHLPDLNLILPGGRLKEYRILFLIVVEATVMMRFFFIDVVKSSRGSSVPNMETSLKAIDTRLSI